MISVHLLLHLGGDSGRPGAVFDHHCIRLLKQREHNLVPNIEVNGLLVRLVLGEYPVDIVQSLLRILF